MARGNAVTRINYALAATLFTSGVTLEEIAPKVGAKNAQSLRVGLHRRGVTLRSATKVLQTATNHQLSNAPITVRLANAANALQRVGERTRSKVAEAAETFANALAERKLPRSLESQNLMADTLAKTAKTAALVHGWENTTINAIVMAGDTTDAIESLCAEPIDVESVPTEQG